MLLYHVPLFSFFRFYLLKNIFDIVFILGSPVCNLRSCTSVTSAIIEEKKRFKDIIILSTPDTYKTSAMKMLEFYKYVAEGLNSYSCLIKLDDD